MRNGWLVGQCIEGVMILCNKHFVVIGAVHILRQPPEGGEGVWQMLTIADEGGRGGKPKADHC